MSAVHFSIPDEVFEAFNAAFAGQDQSAVIAQLMREAVARAQEKQQRHEAIGRILDRRSRAPLRSEDELAALRQEGRP